MIPFKLNFIDHVAIRVKDMETSIQWYKHVIGLEKRQFERWGDFPIFMMKDTFAVAIFPANLKNGELVKSANSTFIDHFAFNISNEDFKKHKIILMELDNVLYFRTTITHIPFTSKTQTSTPSN